MIIIHTSIKKYLLERNCTVAVGWLSAEGELGPNLRVETGMKHNRKWGAAGQEVGGGRGWTAALSASATEAGTPAGRGA